MKKIALLVAGLLACGSALASSDVLLVNTDGESAKMVVSYKICEGTPSQMTCGEVQTVALTGKSVKDPDFTKISLPENHLAVVTAVENTLIHSTKPIKVVFSEKEARCYGSDTGDVIALDSRGTDTVICDNRGAAGKGNTAG